MKSLILGNKGFIGKAIEEYFLQIGWETHGLDLPDFNIEMRYEELVRLNMLPDFGRIDVLINCIGINGAQKSFEALDLYYRLNGFSALTVRDIIQHYNCKSFVHISSETVLGEGEGLDEKNIIQPKHPYSFSKAIFEAFVLSDDTFKRIKTALLRLPIIVGPNNSIPSAFDFIKKDFVDGNPITLFGNGKHKRKFLHVKDVGHAVEIIEKKSNYGLNLFHAPGRVLTMLDLYEFFCGEFNSTPSINFVKPASQSQVATLVSKTSDCFESMKLRDLQ